MELGEDAIKEHKHIIEQIKQMHFSQVILVGGDFEHTVHPYRFFKHVDDACYLAEKSYAIEFHNFNKRIQKYENGKAAGSTVVRQLSHRNMLR